MRRKIVMFALGGLGLVTALVIWQMSYSGAQQAPNGNGGGKMKPPDPLPIRHVVLFNSGVGYFQREGEVEGNASVSLTFPVGDINDLLKSLILQDLNGGRVGAVNYDSHDPIDKILRSFALDLNNNPTYGQILNQARGEKIEVLRREKKDAQPTKTAGTIVGIEVHHESTEKGQVYETEHLNLTTDGGLATIALKEILAVRFLNPVLESEFQRALQVLASSHDTQKKTVSVGFTGAGKRQVKVGYVVERPIWKTTYRLRLDPNGKVFLQGWALVENTSDDDWNDVKMTLISGRPISYRMNLHEPLYIPRPTVEPELFASLRPPVYSGSLVGGLPGPDDRKGGVPGMGGFPGGGQAVGAPPPPQAQGGPANIQPWGWNPQGMNPGMYGGFGGFGNFQGGAFQGSFNGALGMLGGFNGAFGQGNSMNPNFRYQEGFQRGNTFNFNNENQKLTYDELQNRRAQNRDAQEKARKVGGSVAGMNFKEGIASVATAEEIGDYHQYVIDQKVNLPRQKSAMLPIVDQTIEGQKLSIFNESVQSKYPLLGLRLRNTSGMPLTQGPISVFENGAYAGDTRTLDLQPGEDRLLSYALDQATEVKTETKSSPSPQMHFKIGAASLAARYKLRNTKTYTIKNRSNNDRTMIIEHPISSGWSLVEPKPAEKARDVYRFQVAVPAGKTAEFQVVEEQARLDNFALTKAKDVTPHYAVGLGIEVKEVTKVAKDKLTGLRIQKGVLHPTYKMRESKTYLVQNLSSQDREFVVDHVVRPEWVLLGAADEVVKRGPEVFRFTIDAAKGKTASKEIVEELTIKDRVLSLKDLSENMLKEFLTSPVVSAEVKAGLAKWHGLSEKLAESQKQLAEVEKQLKTLSDDQSRLRSNLQIIPQTAEPYKKFLQKFVDQESEIEGFQRQIRQLQSAVQTQQRELTMFIAALNAE